MNTDTVSVFPDSAFIDAIFLPQRKGDKRVFAENFQIKIKLKILIKINIMRKILMLLLFVAGFLNSNAQIKNDVTGKWKMKSIVNDGKMDSAAMVSVKEMMKDFFLHLKENKKYKSNFLNNIEEGTWTYEPNTSKLELTSTRGKGEKFKLKLLTSETALYSIGGEDAMILMRDSVKKEDLIEKPAVNLTFVSITEKQLCKKWYLKKRVVPGQSEDVVKRASDLMKGAFIHFKTDKTFKVEILKISESGKWKLSNGNKTITLSADNESKISNVISISETELVVVGGDSQEIWTYNTKLN